MEKEEIGQDSEDTSGPSRTSEIISQKRSGSTLQQPSHFFRYACVEFFVAP